MKTLVVGMGEVGSALYQLLEKYYPTESISDSSKSCSSKNFDILHITFPYSDQFEKEVSKYQSIFNPQYTVIHSTVPVGTSRKVNSLHSPVRGKHPYLYTSLLTFEKMLGGQESDVVADYFRRTGVKILLFRKQETTELAKLLDTLYYGVCIEFAKEAEHLCEKYNVPFSEVYTLANQTYNEGYSKLGNTEYVRPILLPLQKRIGGHCVLENTELLPDCKFVQFVRELNQNNDKGRLKN